MGSGVTIDHNLFYQDSGSCPGDCKHGTDAVTSDPLFTNKATDDFSITATSPAINTGSATSAPSDDYIGTSRPQGAADDIGAYERILAYGSSFNGVAGASIGYINGLPGQSIGSINGVAV